MYDDEQQQGWLVRPLSPSAWLVLVTMALATAAVVLLGHDPAGADPVSPTDAAAVVTSTAGAGSTWSPAPSDDGWAGLLSSIGIVPDGPVVVTSPAVEATPPPASDGGSQRSSGAQKQKQHGNQGANHGHGGDHGHGRAGSRTDGIAADGQASRRAAHTTWSSGAAVTPAIDGPFAAPGVAVLRGDSAWRDTQLSVAPTAGNSASAVRSTAASPAPSAESRHDPTNDGPSPMPVPAPAVPCSAPGATVLVNATGSSSAPVSATPPAGSHRFNLRRSTCPPEAVAHRAAADARTANGSRGPPDERSQ